MSQSKKKDLPEITWENLAPPYKDYEYFRDCENYPFRYNSNVFDIVNAWWLIEAATLVYAEENFVRENFEKAGLKEVEFFGGKSTECFAASNAKFSIVAFRGTESRRREGETDFRHVVADLKTDFSIGLVESGQGGKVHEGFKNAVDEVWHDLLDYLKSMRRNDRELWITGHSLGAALATLSADRYGDVRGLYTFGSPRVGDIDFKDDFYVNGYRIVNNSDIVTRIPPPGLYHHVGELRYIDSDGLIHDNPSRWERWTDQMSDQVRHGFSGFIPEAIKDHVPTLYAVHIWNNIPNVD